MGATEFEILKWHGEDLGSYQTITLLLQNKRLKQLKFTPLATNIYLSRLPNRTPMDVSFLKKRLGEEY